MGKIKRFIPIFITLFVVFLFYIKRFTPLKFYPPICNFVLFFVFFSSLFTEETVIQKFAKMGGNVLNEKALKYTRNITYIWCVFMFFNLLISIWTLFLSDEIWILYNGFISYILVGLVFGIEYTVRIILQKRKII